MPKIVYDHSKRCKGSHTWQRRKYPGFHCTVCGLTTLISAQTHIETRALNDVIAYHERQQKRLLKKADTEPRRSERTLLTIRAIEHQRSAEDIRNRVWKTASGAKKKT